MSELPVPLIEILATPSTKPKVIMAREFTPDEEYAIICLGIVRALSRWPDTWQEEVGRIAQENLESLAANGGVYPDAELLPEGS